MSAKAAEHIEDGLKIENYWNAEGTPKAQNIDLA